MLNAHPTIFYFQVLGLLSSLSFVSIDLSRCTKKKWSFSILILISNFLRQMRYRWNRHDSYIVNILFLNNLLQKETFFIFCIFVFIRYKGSPLERVSLDRFHKSQRQGTTFLTACASRVRPGRSSSTVGYMQRDGLRRIRECHNPKHMFRKWKNAVSSDSWELHFVTQSFHIENSSQFWICSSRGQTCFLRGVKIFYSYPNTT